MNYNFQPKYVHLRDTIKTTLWIGQFQAGKTTAAIKESKDRQGRDPELISVFIAFGTNTNKENQEKHIKNIYGKKLHLVNCKEDLLALKVRSQKNDLDSSYHGNNPIVISCLGHWASLEILQQILTTTSKYKFHLWLDESDSYSKDFDKQDIKARKDNLIDSIKKLEYHKVEEIICVTATPFTEMVSTTDFSEVTEIPCGLGYIGINLILKSQVELEKEDITEFNSGILSPEIMQILSSENAKKNTVTLISTTTRMEGHKLQCHAIEKYLNDPKTLVAELNSNKGNKYFSPLFQDRNIPIRPFYGNRGDQLAELFAVAENFEKLFIVGGGMLDRSVTLKSDKFNSFSGYIYSAGREVSLPSLLQRAARACGYQVLIPQFYTDVVSKMYLAKLDYPTYIKITQDNPKAKERRAALFNVLRKDVNYKRPLGRYRTNNTGDKARPRSVQYVAETPEEVNGYGYKILNEFKEFESNDLPEDVLKQLQNNKKAQRGTPLQKFIWDNFPHSNRILNVRGIEGKEFDYTTWQLPNNKVADFYRDTLYDWHKNTLAVSVQPFQTVRGKYAVQNILTKEFNCYNEDGAFAQHN